MKKISLLFLVILLAAFTFSLVLFSLLGVRCSLAQDISGRWKASLDLTPQTTSNEAALFDFDFGTQFGLGLDFEQLGFSGTTYFTNLGLDRVWFSWGATFPGGDVKVGRTVRTLKSNDWIEVIRSYPEWAAPGEQIEVEITIEALQAGVGEVEVIELHPSGWKLDPIIPAGRGIDSRGRRYKINLTNQGDKVTIRYKALVPSDTKEDGYKLEGTVESTAFDDLDFTGRIKIVPRAPSRAGLFAIRNGVTFSLSDGTLMFSNMDLDSSSQFIDFRLDNYFGLNNTGSVGNPDIEMEDTVVLDGVTIGGVGVRLVLDFGSDSDMLGFEKGSLRVATLTIADIAFEGRADFELDGFDEFELETQYELEVFDAQLELQSDLIFNEDFSILLNDFDINLRSLIDGNLRIYNDYSEKDYDEDNDGTEETHFVLDRRRINLNFKIDDLGVSTQLTFEPIFEDLDSDGADERSAKSQLTGADIRLSKSVGNTSFSGGFTFEQEVESAGEPLSLGRITFRTRSSFKVLYFSASISLDLLDGDFRGGLGIGMSF